MSNTKVILLADVEGLGSLGDVATVKAGYARNMLLPQKLAMRHTAEAVSKLEELKAEIVKQQQEARKGLEKFHDRLNEYLLQIAMPAESDGKLYGALSRSMIAKHLRAQGYEVEQKQINLPDSGPIKQIGEHELTVTIASDLVADVKLSVVSERPVEAAA